MRLLFTVLIALTALGFLPETTLAQCVDVDGDGCLECPPGRDPLDDGPDADMDGLCDAGEEAAGTDPMDADTDDDGVRDGDEPLWSEDLDGDGLVGAADPDADGDGLLDGTELGLTAADIGPDTDASRFVPDSDPTTQTDPTLPDSDFGGVPDGYEDLDRDGRVDLVETDPNVRGDDDVDRDDDGDTIPSLVEGLADADGDGIYDFLDDDSDGDSISDRTEAGDEDPRTSPIDSDGDRVPDFQDLDSDGDLIGDVHEAGDDQFATPPIDTDEDGVPDYLDLDADGDTIADREEAGDESLSTPPVDTDGDGLADAVDLDSDADTISDLFETLDADPGTPPVDSDMDGVPDYRDTDSDDDAIADVDEAGDAFLETAPVDTDGDDAADYLDDDSDADGVSDRDEAFDADLLTPPADTDGDGVPDFLDEDSDDDGTRDRAEAGDADPSTPPVDLDDDDIPDLRDGDSDGDGVHDARDNCRRVANPQQEDFDFSGEGDACDDDIDGDTIVDDADNCPDVANFDQADADGDGVGDACQNGVPNSEFPPRLMAAGGGCSSSGSTSSGSTSSGSTAWLLLLMLVFLRRPARGADRSVGRTAGRIKGWLAGAAMVVMCHAGTVSAQPTEPGEVALDRFGLSTDRNGIANAESPDVGEHLALQGALWVGVVDDPLVARDSNGRAFALVHRRVAGELVLTLPLLDAVSFAVAMPVTFFQNRSSNVDELSESLVQLDPGLGDLRIVPKASLLQQEKHGISLAVLSTFTIPLGDTGDYLRERRATFAPELVLGGRVGPLRLQGSIGYRQRARAEVLGVVVNDEVFAEFGAAYVVDSVDLELHLAAHFAFSASDPFETKAQTPLEVLAGAQLETAYAIPFVALGLGVSRGIGVPDWRLIAGVRLGAFGTGTPAPEICSEELEDYDGFEDADGCPDVDNDGDGILDEDDDCAGEAEDEDGFEDEDGCPDLDDDEDGILDDEDPCPQTPGDCSEDSEDADTDTAE